MTEPASTVEPAPPSGSVARGRAPTTADLAWADLAAELGPVKSLARVDAATARVISTITVIGVLISGFGIAATSSTAIHGTARVLLAVTVAVAAVAVATALAAQVLTIARRLNPGNLVEVKAWYGGVFARRARLTQTATAFLVIAGLSGGAVGVLVITQPKPTPPMTPSITVTRTISADDGNATVAVQVILRGMKAAQPAHASIRDEQADVVQAEAVTVAGPDGIAALTLAADGLPADDQVQIAADGGGRNCQATLGATGGGPVITCRTK